MFGFKLTRIEAEAESVKVFLKYLVVKVSYAG